MRRTITRVVLPAIVVAAAFASLAPRLMGQSSGMPSTKNGEWPMYTADLRGSKYSPLDQITASNFNQLEVAWRFKTDNLGPRPENKLEGTPIMGDVFNLFNANTVLVRNNNIQSTTFNQIVQNLSPRIVRFGVEIGF